MPQFFNALWPSNDSFVYAFPWLRWYALFFMMGMLVAIAIACIRIQTYYQIKYDIFFYFALIVIPVSLIGARFWSACIGDLDWKNFFNFTTSGGGLAIQGGVVFSIIAGLIYFPLMLRKPKYHVRVQNGDNVYILKPSLWIVIDAILPCIFIGQAIGRWGNFFNGEIYGQQVSAQSLTWLDNIMPGVFDRMSSYTNGVSNHIYYQPLFLYESILNTIFFAIIYFMVPTFGFVKIGVIGSLYLLVYGIERNCMETLRDSSYNFNATYILNSLMLASGLFMLIMAQWVTPRFRKKQVIYYFYCRWIRLNVIKWFKWTKWNWITKALNDDKNLEKFGFKKAPSFVREDCDMLYYANK